MIFHSQPLSEFVLTCAQGIRANLCPGHSGLIPSHRTKTPNLPILPSLPQSHNVITQNKPNFLKAKTAATLCATRTYPNYPPRPARKNKPNLSRRSLWRSRNKPNSPAQAAHNTVFSGSTAILTHSAGVIILLRKCNLSSCN